MYMNHLQYHRHLILSLQAEMDDFPQAWGFDTPLPWESRIRTLCRPLLKNISEVYRKASSTRSLVGPLCTKTSDAIWQTDQT